jgi:DNA-binding response OmpR family regulator
METVNRTRRVRFGALDSGELRKQGIKIKIHDQPFQVVAMLLEHPGQVVTREQLRQKLWPADTSWTLIWA